MTALVCSDLIQSAHTQQSITFHLHITAPRCSKRLRTIAILVNLINFPLPVEYGYVCATASTICLRRQCRYHVSIVWIVVHAVIHVTRRHFTTCDVTHPCHLQLSTQGNRTRGVFTRLVTHGANSRRANVLFSCTNRNFSVPFVGLFQAVLTLFCFQTSHPHFHLLLTVWLRYIYINSRGVG